MDNWLQPEAKIIITIKHKTSSCKVMRGNTISSLKFHHRVTTLPVFYAKFAQFSPIKSYWYIQLHLIQQIIVLNSIDHPVHVLENHPLPSPRKTFWAWKSWVRVSNSAWMMPSHLSLSQTRTLATLHLQKPPLLLWGHAHVTSALEGGGVPKKADERNKISWFLNWVTRQDVAQELEGN